MNRNLIAGGVLLLVMAAAAFLILYPGFPNKEQPILTSKGMTSVASSTAPKERSFGFIYEREAKVSKDGKLSNEFVLYDLSNKTLSKLDTSMPAAWQGIGGASVILYLRDEDTRGSNKFDISAFDLTSLSVGKIAVPSDINAYSSIAYSPAEKKVAYCADDETVFDILNLDSGKKEALPSFSGCLANSSFNPPAFSSDGKDIYYQEFSPLNEDGTYNSIYRYRKLSLATGASSDVPNNEIISLRFDTKRKWLATMETVGNDVDSYSNQFAILDLSATPDKEINAVVRSGAAPVVIREALGTYVHIGDIQKTNDGSGFFFYTSTKKDRNSEGGDFKIGYFDNEKKILTYPIGAIPNGYGPMSLIGARDKDIVVFRMRNKTTGLSDVFYASVAANAVELVDKSTGLSLPEKVYFIESK